MNCWMTSGQTRPAGCSAFDDGHGSASGDRPGLDAGGARPPIRASLSTRRISSGCAPGSAGRGPSSGCRTSWRKGPAGSFARESEERLKLVLSAADLGTWDWDVQSGAVDVQRSLGGDARVRAGRDPSGHPRMGEPGSPGRHARRRKTLAAHLEGEKASYESEYRMKRRSGEWSWILDKGHVIGRDPQGGPSRVCGTHIDITARKQAEEALRDRERYLRRMFQTTADGIWLLDAGGKGQGRKRRLLPHVGLRQGRDAEDGHPRSRSPRGTG